MPRHHPWIWVYGLWLMAYGLWLMAYGLQFMVYGLRFTVYGLWFTVYGLWFMVYGLRASLNTQSLRPTAQNRNLPKLITSLVVGFRISINFCSVQSLRQIKR
jgi:hypothetical protein